MALADALDRASKKSIAMMKADRPIRFNIDAPHPDYPGCVTLRCRPRITTANQFNAVHGLRLRHISWAEVENNPAILEEMMEEMATAIFAAIDAAPPGIVPSPVLLDLTAEFAEWRRDMIEQHGEAALDAVTHAAMTGGAKHSYWDLDYLISTVRTAWNERQHQQHRTMGNA